MIILKPEHINEILIALQHRERDIVKEASEDKKHNQGRWPEAAHEALKYTQQARAALIEERERHPGVTFIVTVPGPNQVGSHGTTDERGRMVWRAAGDEVPVLTDEPGKITKLTGPRSVSHPGD